MCSTDKQDFDLDSMEGGMTLIEWLTVLRLRRLGPHEEHVYQRTTLLIFFLNIADSHDN